MICLQLLESQRIYLLGYFFLEPRRGGISIANRGPQSLEPRRGDMYKTVPFAYRSIVSK